MTDTSTPTQSTLDLVDFETVRDDGVIETAETYTRLIELTPRPWLTASETTRDSVYAAFTRALRGISFPVQFLTYTSSVPIDEYLERFEQAHSPWHAQRAVAAARTASTDDDTSKTTDTGGPPDANKRSDTGENADVGGLPTDGGVVVNASDKLPFDSSDDPHFNEFNETIPDDMEGVDGSPILAYGRLTHAQWVDQAVQTGTGRDRQYFVAVAVRKDSTPPASRSTLEDLRYTLQQFLPTRQDAIDPETEQRCITELRTRAQHLASKLPRTGADTEILTDRPSVLEVLYQYYHAEPTRVTLDHAWLTRTDRDPDIEPAVDADTPATDTGSPTNGDRPESVGEKADITTSSGGDGNGGA